MATAETIRGGMREVGSAYAKAVCAVEAAQDALEKAIDNLHQKVSFQNPYVTMPYMWSKGDGRGGPRVESPLTIEVDLSLDDDDGAHLWRIDLSTLVDDVIEMHVLSDGSISYESQAGTIMPIADALQGLVDKLRAIPVKD